MVVRPWETWATVLMPCPHARAQKEAVLQGCVRRAESHGQQGCAGFHTLVSIPAPCVRISNSVPRFFADLLQHLFHFTGVVFLLCFTSAVEIIALLDLRGLGPGFSYRLVCSDSTLQLCAMVKYLQLWANVRWLNLVSCVWGQCAQKWDNKMLMVVQVIMGSARLHSLAWEKGVEVQIVALSCQMLHKTSLLWSSVVKIEFIWGDKIPLFWLRFLNV